MCYTDMFGIKEFLQFADKYGLEDHTLWSLTLVHFSMDVPSTCLGYLIVVMSLPVKCMSLLLGPGDSGLLALHSKFCVFVFFPHL
jgi:hypothetical protein